ncbi:MAG: substrate-binding domain-containing protein [Planctomycetales bacterium]|nr:substrate-binding domain-containing protein [Planctomycetales bacterium]
MRKSFAGLALVAVAGGSGCGQRNPSAIVAYGRENNSGTYMYFKEHVLGNSDFAANVQTLPGTAAVINAVSKDPRAIGYGGIGYVKGVRTLRVKKDAASAAVEPTLANVVTGAYPISRYLYFYSLGEPEGAVRAYIEWARSEAGQKVCEGVGYYPIPAEKRVAAPVAPPAEASTITVKGSDTMVILGQRWAEEYMKLHPGLVIQITGGGSGTGIKALIEGSTHICQSSRPINAKERDHVKAKHGKEAVEFPVAMDGLAVFVHESSAMQEISLDQLKGIYTGEVKAWNELAPASR